jgi:hypothetical protein
MRRKYNVLTVTKFVKSHKMNIGLGVDHVNCGGMEILCIRNTAEFVCYLCNLRIIVFIMLNRNRNASHCLFIIVSFV